jgi:carbon starvation protein
MFGSANQLLATIALTIGTSYIINQGKIRYAWVTLIPLAFVGITTFVAGIMNIIGIYIPQMSSDKMYVQGSINLALTLIIMLSVVIILKDAIPGWLKALKEYQ